MNGHDFERVARVRHREVIRVRLPVDQAAAMFAAQFAARVVDENAAHGLGGGGEEVAAAVPVPLFPWADQAQVRLVDQGRRLQRLAGLLTCHPLGREPAQLVVHQRQELRRGTSIALPDGVQDAGHLIHRQYRSNGESQRKVRA